MDERKLKVFITAVRKGSFSKAAEELNFSQSAVSQTIHSLETDLGCKLVERKYNGVELTEEGKILYPSMIHAESAISLVREQALRLKKEMNSVIRIGCFSSISNTWLPEILLAYQNIHPDSSFDIRIGFREIEKWLLAGEIDLALADVKLSQSLEWQPLFNEPYYAVMPASYVKEGQKEIHQEELLKYPFIRVPSNILHNSSKDMFKKQVNVSGDDDYTLLAMIAKGLGISIMPTACLHNLPESVCALSLIPARERTLGVAMKEEAGQEVREFIDYLKRCTGENKVHTL